MLVAATLILNYLFSLPPNWWIYLKNTQNKNFGNIGKLVVVKQLKDSLYVATLVVLHKVKYFKNKLKWLYIN